ncbi:MAG TPA: hypothetical protein VFB84_00150 [Micromonosporaceae bacterium]|nr:hypothetical protein [Micromonosporaceae bacterium]
MSTEPPTQRPQDAAAEQPPNEPMPETQKKAWKAFQGIVLRNIYLSAALGTLLGASLVLVGAIVASEPLRLTLSRVIGGFGLAVLTTVFGVSAGLVLGEWLNIKERIGQMLHEAQLSEVQQLGRQIDQLGRDQAQLADEVTNRLAEIERLEHEIRIRNADADALGRAGVLRVFEGRSESFAHVIRSIREPTTATIRIAGIRLADFVRQTSGPWQEIVGIIHDRKNSAERLEVKVLLLDPRCAAARALTFRRGDDAGNTRRSRELRREIELSSDRILRQAGTHPGNVSVELRFYRADPHSFIVATNSSAFTQPYTATYLDEPAPVHVTQYAGGSTGHAAVISQFDMLWQERSVSYDEIFRAGSIGVDAAIRDAGITNIYTNEDSAYRRMRWLLEGAGERVWLQGVSLKPMYNRPLDIAMNQLAQPQSAHIDVRMLMLDPGCDAAFTKTYHHFADEYPTVGDYKRNGVEQHRRTELYNSIVDNLRRLGDLVRGGAQNFQIRTYTCSPVAFVMLTDRYALGEQYHYGVPPRPSALSDLRLCDLPLIEYAFQDGHGGYSRLAEHYDNVFHDLAEPLRLA